MFSCCRDTTRSLYFSALFYKPPLLLGKKKGFFFPHTPALWKNPPLLKTPGAIITRAFSLVSPNINSFPPFQRGAQSPLGFKPFPPVPFPPRARPRNFCPGPNAALSLRAGILRGLLLPWPPINHGLKKMGFFPAVII